MQTFLPFPSFKDSAQVLDRMRLGKQRVETLQVLQRLLGYRLISKDTTGRPLPKEKWTLEEITTTGWSNHPAVLMWKNHELALASYQTYICHEWIIRGYKDTCQEKSEFLINKFDTLSNDNNPSWLGNNEFHLSHQSNLLRKDPEHYRQYWPKLRDDLPYIWPTP